MYGTAEAAPFQSFEFSFSKPCTAFLQDSRCNLHFTNAPASRRTPSTHVAETPHRQPFYLSEIVESIQTRTDSSWSATVTRVTSPAFSRALMAASMLS